jgi:tetratricopeptide (TPR) repeat protein
LIVLSTATLLGALGGFAYHYGDVRRERDDARAEVERDRAELARAELRSEALQDNARGRAALDTDSIEQCRSAESLLSRSLTKVEQDPLLEDVCRSLARTLAAIRSRLTEDDARRRDARQLDEFRRLRDAAKFSASQSSGLNLVEGWKATRTAARNGLAVFGMGTGDRVAPTLAGRHLDQPETQEVRDGCYELLLILAHAVAEPVSGEETARAQAEQSLALLERAARVRGKPTAAYFLERAHCLHQMDDIEGERRELQRADSADAQAETGLDGFLIGNALYQRGNLAGAAKRFGGVVGVEPRNFWAHYLLAVCHLKSQPRELKLALARLDSCAGLKPDFAWTYLLRGFARSELGEFEAAAKDLDTAAKLLRPDEASGRYTLLVNRGVMRLRQTRTAEAVADFQAAVTLKPDEINARVNLAKAYQEQGRPAKAIREYERVIERQPKLAFLHASRARLLFEQKDLAGALAGFEQAIRVTEAGLPAGQKVPDGREEKEALAEYHSWRGVILYRTKQPKKALRAYAAALRLDPNYPVAQRERAFLLLDLKRYQEASQAFDEYLRKWRPRGPLAVEVYEARGRARMELGDFAAALEDQSGLVALDRHSARFAARGWLYVVSSAPVLALHDFEEAVKLDPANGDAYNGRGFARVKLGRYREAVEDAEEALRHGPRKARLVYNAARTYAQAAERAEHDPAAQRRYQDRALDLLRAALALTRAEDRPRFWWETVRQDAALVRLRRNTAFAQMGATYPKPMGKRER